MEFVYVVPRTSLFPEFYPRGLVPFGTDLSLEGFDAIVAGEGFFVERAYAERTPSLKQVIPYSIVECGDRILLLRRLTRGGEARLHDKLSIGVGGHVNPEDLLNGTGTSESAGRRDPLAAGTRRELEEELHVSGGYKVRRVGIINDDSNAVGAVHVGVVQIVTVQGTVSIREHDQLEGRLVASDELRALRDQGADFETWSEILIERLDEVLPQPAGARPS
jgi:predicted NUDIX family phosphoesterase